MKNLDTRRSIRQYSKQEVSDELLSRLFAQASRTQTMGNLQLYSVVVTRSEAMKQRLAPAHFNQPMVTGAPVVLTICADFHRTSQWAACRKATPGYDNFLSFQNAAIDALLFTQTLCCLMDEEGLGYCYLGTTVYQPQQIIDILQLPRQNHSTGIAVSSALLKPVVLFHSLIIQIFSVNHEKDFINIGELRRLSGCFEGCKRLAGAGSVPDISATGNSSIFLIVVGNLNTVQNTFRSCNLIRTHDHQHIFRSENTVFDQYIQNCMPRKKCLCKINQIRNHTILSIRPETGKFKAVAGLFLLLSAGFCIFDSIKAGAIGIVFGVSSIAYNKNLYILKETRSYPKGIPLVTIYLIKCLPNCHTSPLQFHMDHRKSIDKNRHIIAIRCLTACRRILPHHLQTILMMILFSLQNFIHGTIQSLFPAKFI